MLAEQSYGGHTSVHDEETAASLDLAGAPIEGPTHFSQFDPLLAILWGDRWFAHGCLSAHFQTMVVEGEEVRTTVTVSGPPPDSGCQCMSSGRSPRATVFALLPLLALALLALRRRGQAGR